ncbi:hypothetical protein Tco_1316507 [Tanacetum coccineum]
MFCYLRQSINMGLWYSNDSRFELISYADADHAGCHDDCKSISGGIQFLGDKLVSWSSKKQDCTTMSTTEAEYVSLSACLQHSRTKHINIRYHFIKENVEQGTIELYFVKTEYQLADLFTNPFQKKAASGNPDHLFIEPADLKFIQIFLKIIGYEGIVDKVSAFFTKNLAQPWQTMFKVFNHCLTTRTSGANLVEADLRRREMLPYEYFDDLCDYDDMGGT